MNKTIIKTISCLALASTLLLSSCGDKSPEETTAPETTAKTENKYSEYPEIDYMAEDLSRYITLGQYKGLEIEITPKKEITDAEVAEKIAADLVYNGYTEKVTDRAVTKNDTVSISFVGLLDGVAFAGGTGDKDNFTIYDGGGFIDGFADGLIGVMPGVEVALDLTFPEKYHSADLAGKAVVFKVTVHHIYEAKELTDEIANSMTKGKHATAAAMTEYYRARLVEENDKEYKDARADIVWSRIFNGVTNVNIPDEMINELYDYQIYWAGFYAERQGVDLDTFLASNGDSRESLLEDTKNNILTNMVVYHIMKTENMTLSDEEFLEFIEESGHSEEEWYAQYSKEEMTDMFLYTKTFYAVPDWQTYTEKEVG